MDQIRFGDLLRFSFPPLHSEEEEGLVGNAYLMTWIVFSYFLLVQTLEMQLITAFSSSPFSIPIVIRLLINPAGILGVAALLGALPLVWVIYRLDGIQGLKETFSGMVLAWKFNSGDQSLSGRLGLDLFIGATLGIFIGFAIFPLGILVGIPLAGFIFLMFFGLGISFFISLYLSVLLGWASALAFLYLGMLRLVNHTEENPPSPEPILSERAKEILLSNQDPVLCPACGSFNAAHRQFCAVCNGPLDQDRDSL